MPRLYVANLGHQPHEFHYRLPAGEGLGDKVHVQVLEPGTQQLIYTEAPRSTLEAIIEQHRQFGIIEASEVIRTKDFVGRCFSFDEPIKSDQLGYAHDRNRGVLFDLGAKRRQELAAAADLSVERHLQDLQRRGVVPGNVRVRAVETEMLEESDDPQFAEGIRVDHLNGDRRRA